jgi:sugar phosphate isomerase/epimerase
MKLALSTNWCARSFASGEEIVEAALAVGADALEAGFRSTKEQLAGFRRRLDELPVGSLHAFAPAPLSAPVASPELYSLLAPDEDARALARFYVLESARAAAELGAETVVLHAGRVALGSLFDPGGGTGRLRAACAACGGRTDDRRYRRLLEKTLARRRRRGEARIDVLCRELERLAPDLEKLNVVLALENLPYLEGFPDEREMAAVSAKTSGLPVAAWFDTGHDRVRRSFGFIGPDAPAFAYRGVHLNDVRDFEDDHLPPGEGKVDFAALLPVLRAARHVVVEPAETVSPERLAAGFAAIRALDGE